MKNTTYRERLALFSNGIAVTIHDVFIDTKNIKIDFKSVNPLVTIFTYKCMFDRGCICDFVLAIIYDKERKETDALGQCKRC